MRSHNSPAFRLFLTIDAEVEVEKSECESTTPTHPTHYLIFYSAWSLAVIYISRTGSFTRYLLRATYQSIVRSGSLTRFDCHQRNLSPYCSYMRRSEKSNY
ncbi:hypothetical protein BDDG_09955 [Blastomyces dermatitidis ATCC 18188]|uniref:Uncharacterized protein n=1 Tax=Ajellomyces dermatitidis (strain ATCC 18188 / CBS 674.68) TaxID=653446 RepID=F2TUU1_AJEDA|nr:hypothetical protein BDDG_09955 [Blastomyces dermatitidis ATCC 18188]